MLIPETLYQLAALLVLVLPGILYAAVRRWLRGPSPEDRDFSVRLIRAVAMSAVLDGLYVLALGPHIVGLARAMATRPGAPKGFAAHPRETAAIGLLLLVAMPVALGLLTCLRVIPKDERSRSWRPFGLVAGYHPTPSGWDYAAPERGNSFVRIFTADGHWVGGWIGTNGFVSTYPEPRDIFIEVEWYMTEDGEFRKAVEGSRGLYVPLSSTERVAWIAKPDQSS